MPVDPGSFPRWMPCLTGIASLALAGCGLGPGTDPGLASAIKQHYAAHATEEQGNCRSPKIDSIQEHRVLDKSADGEEVMIVRYSYFDRHADMDANWDKFVHLSQPCGGIAERRFVLSRDAVGYRVTAMSGEHRGEDGTR